MADGEPWIAFQQFLGKSAVMLVRPDGSGLHSPTRTVPGGDQTNPDWSPDGSRLVFAVASGSHENLWVVNADGTGARLLADCTGECANLDDPAWSPDGRSVLYSRNGTDAAGEVVSSLEQVDVASGASEVLVRAEPGHFYAGQRWSPDGKSIVLEVVELTGPDASSDVEDVSLAVIDVDSPTPEGRELLGSKRFPETAAWSPDGSLIVFGALEAPGQSGTSLYAIKPDGTGLRQLTRDVRSTHPELSRDGSAVLFAATMPGRDSTVLAQVPLDGGEITPATGPEFIEGVHPRFRPVP
ncbi:MAG TPA: hypothetical protein VFY23_14465 [Candidatus Limnocylindrales bacterium]|nr:hypothetical protein [Candidatus Limnocylindrales bacterium]